MKRRDILRSTWITVSLLVLLLMGLSSEFPTAQVKMEKFPYQRKLSKKERKWIHKQLKRMRLEEKIGQMLMVKVPAGFVNLESDEFKQLRHRILENHVGGIMLGEGGVYAAAMLINRLQELARFPLLVACDLEAGAGMRLRGATNFPWNMAVGATGDPLWAERQGAITAQEARVVGINVLFAPVADLSRQPRNPINVRAYGDDPMQVARFVAAYIRGAQTYGVLATVKYFPGYGSASRAAKGGFPTMTASVQQLKATEMPPFGAAILSRVGAIMVGHIVVPALDATPLGHGTKTAASGAAPPGLTPVTFSSSILTGSLRRRSNFDGLIITDSLQSKNVMAHFDSAGAALQAVKAGADILLSPSDVDQAMRALWDAVRRGEVKEQRLDDSVTRILTAKARLGLAANRFTDIDILDDFVSARRFRQTAQSIAQQSVTLLRNDQGLIPIQPASTRSILHIAVIAADTNEQERQVVGRALSSELRRKIPATERVVIDRATPPDQAPHILRRSQKAALVIVSLFAHPQAQPERLALPAAGAAVLDQLLKRGRPVIVVSFGNPYPLVDYPNIPTTICAYGDARDSAPSQKAVARALLGEIPFQGKLPVALARLYPRGQGILIGGPRPQAKPKRR